MKISPRIEYPASMRIAYQVIYPIRCKVLKKMELEKWIIRGCKGSKRVTEANKRVTESVS